METGKEVKEISFADLNPGDRVVVKTGPGYPQILDITITSKRKDGLRVKVNEEVENAEFIAICPGVITDTKGKEKLIPCIKITTPNETNWLVFRDLKDTKSHKDICSRMSTTPIQKITLFKVANQ